MSVFEDDCHDGVIQLINLFKRPSGLPYSQHLFNSMVHFSNNARTVIQETADLKSKCIELRVYRQLSLSSTENKHIESMHGDSIFTLRRKFSIENHKTGNHNGTC